MHCRKAPFSVLQARAVLAVDFLRSLMTKFDNKNWTGNEQVD